MKGKHSKGGHHKKAAGGDVVSKMEHAEKHKHGGKVHEAKGKKEHHRADKRARGGRMSPSSPLSGANPTKMRTGAKMGGKPDKEND